MAGHRGQNVLTVVVGGGNPGRIWVGESDRRPIATHSLVMVKALYKVGKKLKTLRLYVIYSFNNPSRKHVFHTKTSPASENIIQGYTIS